MDQTDAKIKFKTEKTAQVKHLILFNDALLVTTKKTRNDKTTFKMKIYINLLQSVVDCVADDTLKLMQGTNMWSITFDSKIQCTQWTRHLEKLVASLTKSF